MYLWIPRPLYTLSLLHPLLVSPYKSNTGHELIPMTDVDLTVRTSFMVRIAYTPDKYCNLDMIETSACMYIKVSTIIMCSYKTKSLYLLYKKLERKGNFLKSSLKSKKKKNAFELALRGTLRSIMQAWV